MIFASSQQKDIFFLKRLESRLDSPVWQSSTILNSRCPVCGDGKYNKKKKRFFLLPGKTSYIYYCHNCGVSGSLFNFLKLYHSDLYTDYIFKEFENKVSQNESESLSSLIAPDMNSLLKSSHDGFEYFEEMFIPVEKLTKTDPFRLYLYNRDIDVQNSEKGKFFVLMDSLEFLKRNGVDDNKVAYIPPCLAIPFFRRDKSFVIFQIRMIDMVSPSWKGPKYMTFKKTPEAKKVYGEDFVDKTKPVYVVEGPIDSMFLDNSIAVGGSDLDQEWDFDAVYVFDNQPKNAAILSKMNKCISKNMKIVIWPKYMIGLKDINEIILGGTSRIDLKKIIEQRTFSGLEAKIEFEYWKNNS